MIKAELTPFDTNLIVKYPEINKSFLIKPYKGKQSVKMLAKLTKYASGMFGGILQGILGDVEGETEEDKLDTISMLMTGALQGAFETLDDDNFLNFFYEIFGSTSVDNKVIDFDEEFSGATMGVAFDLARHIIVHNFKPVFHQLGIAALLKPKAPNESEDRG